MTLTKDTFEKTYGDIADRLLAYAMEKGKDYGITDARISASVSTRLSAEIEQGEVSKNVSGASHTIGVTLYAGDRVLSFSVNGLDVDAVCETIESNMKVIHLVPENKNLRLLESERLSKEPPVDLDLFDSSDTGSDALIDYARTVESAALKQDKIKTTRSTSAGKTVVHTLIRATNGLDYASSRTSYSAGTSVIAADQSGMQVNYDGSYARHFSDMEDPVAVGTRAGLDAAAKLGASLPSTGQVPIVLSPDAAEDFFRSVISAIDGGALHRGTTFLKDKLGKQVMSEGVTILDTPRLPRGGASSQIDTAGLPTRDVTFIKNGVLTAFNLSLAESRQLGMKPTGRENGTTNTSVLPGTISPDALIASVGDGIYIKGFNGGTVDVNNGTHSRQAYGLLIKNGQLTDIPVDGFVVSGNLKDMFMQVTLANDTPQLPSPRHSLAAPTTRIDGITIAGK